MRSGPMAILARKDKPDVVAANMTKHSALSLLLVCIFSFLGSAFMQYMMSANNATAAERLAKQVAQWVDRDKVLLQQYYDAKGVARLDSGLIDGNPIQDFYGPDGKIRLQFGTYTAAGEAGLPLVALSDNQGEIRLLLRLAGANESPVLIFKDKQHRDRMIMGLGLSGEQEPFLAYFDKNGQKRMAFGEY